MLTINRLLIALLILTLINSCFEKEKSPNNKEVSNIATERQKNNTKEVSNKPISPFHKKPFKNSDRLKVIQLSKEKTTKKKKYFINNEIFITDSDLFIKGEQLLNTSFNQYGTLTGSIVIIIKKSLTKNEINKLLSQITESLNTTSIKEIALNTYNITFPAKQNLLKNYQQLEDMVHVTKTELGIDYTPLNKNPTF